jgi:hypothetical protein
MFGVSGSVSDVGGWLNIMLEFLEIPTGLIDKKMLKTQNVNKKEWTQRRTVCRNSDNA